MEPVYEVTGEELKRLLAYLRAEFSGDGVYKLSFAIDGGAKVKVNEHSWTPPMGALRP